jgi:hypothetical protein
MITLYEYTVILKDDGRFIFELQTRKYSWLKLQIQKLTPSRNKPK